MFSHESLPPFDSTRLATVEDLPRIATVAAASFFHSPTFQFQRPYYNEHPEDTLLSYWTEYQTCMDDPATVVLVAEDVWNGSESESVYKALPSAPSYCCGSRSPLKVIVGVCSISLKSGSEHIGKFQSPAQVVPPKPHAAPKSMNRDACREAARVYNEITGPSKAKYLKGEMRLSTLAVHPAYWQRGHATRLVTWCTCLADMDGVPLGISAVPQGVMVAIKFGFEEQETIRIERSAVRHIPVHRNASRFTPVQLWVAIRPPSGSSSDASTSSSESFPMDSQ